MNCSPTLTPDEFKDIHNAKCELHVILHTIESIVNPKIVTQLKNTIELLNKGLKSAYEQDDAEFNRASKHAEEVGEEIGVKSIWSMYEVPDLRAPHPWPEHQLLSYQGMGDVGEVKVRIEGPLWSDLWMAADKAIKLSGDSHHIFIEGFDQSNTRDFELVLHTGS